MTTMTDYVTAYQNPSNCYHREANGLVERFGTRATITDGVIRWNSNGTVIPADCALLAQHIGLPIDLAKCTDARDIEARAFLASYRTREATRVQTPEELGEMRAAFGRGALAIRSPREVVNVITGNVTRL